MLKKFNSEYIENILFKSVVLVLASQFTSLPRKNNKFFFVVPYERDCPHQEP